MFKRIFCVMAMVACLAMTSNLGDFKGPQLGNLPTISTIRNKEGVQGRPTKVFMMAIIGGSAFTNQFDIGKGLSRERDADGNPLYDVTLLVANNQKKVKGKETDTLHFIEFPFAQEELTVHQQGATPLEMMSVMKDVMKRCFTIFKENHSVMEDLRARNFDVSLVSFLPVEPLIAQALGIPYLY